MNRGGFSWKRALGVTKVKQNISRKIGIPLTRSGRQRKLGKMMGGCYIATSVYGSYDSPEVLILRNYRDDTLMNSWYGRLFVGIYYRISPLIVKLFGEKIWFNRFWKTQLDKFIQYLNQN